ncbi:hypothetical protein EXIGLDRAFT_472702 [Exidia glandulosa HHB12029]|uniref:Uncharacterized protein n=1 Tax=Exidia glandulosa HHB12029 TaxID=1314781 RepID=A0A165JXK6_EXIGL|nr:hypothetical protein EXIGLDRAFT_472702 [Exidia glandulosa HHB12029]
MRLLVSGYRKGRFPRRSGANLCPSRLTMRVPHVHSRYICRQVAMKYVMPVSSSVSRLCVMQRFLQVVLLWICTLALLCSCAPQDVVRSRNNGRDLDTTSLDPELFPRPSSGFRSVGIPAVSVSRDDAGVIPLWHRILAAARSSSSSASSSANSGGASSSSSVGDQPTSPQSSNSGGSESDGGLSTGGIIGTVLGVVAAALGLGTAIFQWLKSRRDGETVESAKKPFA